MSKDPAILFYTGDFLNGCTDLTFEERGQYITLLCLQHQKGHLSEKTIRLTVGSVSVDVLSKFERDDDGFFYNQRLEDEINKRRHFLDTRYINGKKGGRPPKPNKKPNGKPTDNLPEDENISSYVLLFNKVITENNIELKEELKLLFLEWLKYKSEKRQSYKETGLKSFLIKSMNECEGDPEILREMILHSTANNYDGLFKEKKYGINKKGGITDAELADLMARKHGIDAPGR